MKLLVTGGAGFIGSHIADGLLAKGHTVHILDNMSSGQQQNIPGAAVFHQLDIQDAAAAQLIISEKYDAVFHQAAQIDVRKSVEDPGYDARVNIVGSLNLMEACLKAGGTKFIFASSGGAGYGEPDYCPMDERHPIRPLSPYGVAKVSVEQYLYYYHAVHGLPYISLRYANVYGPRQNPHGEAGVVAIFIQRLMGGMQPVINGDGLQTRDYVYVGDVADANLRALTHPTSGCYNVGTGVESTVVDVYEGINERLGRPRTRQHGPAKAGEQRRSVLAWHHIHEQMGWTPRHTLETGLTETVNWFRAQAGR